ncbi:MAG: hypothetical protein HYS33_06540 [Acidobacteria bacterium]|nr:hypothetical protein [Acidobacteriota bacterium]
MSATNSVQVGSQAPDLSYVTLQGESRRLADLWNESPALVIWLRHFG